MRPLPPAGKGRWSITANVPAAPPLEFEDIPNVEYVHSLLYREVNDNPDDDFHTTQRLRRREGR